MYPIPINIHKSRRILWRVKIQSLQAPQLSMESIICGTMMGLLEKGGCMASEAVLLTCIQIFIAMMMLLIMLQINKIWTMCLSIGRPSIPWRVGMLFILQLEPIVAVWMCVKPNLNCK